MLDRLCMYEPVEAARAASLLSPYWARSGAVVDARARLQTILSLDLPDASRAAVLYRLAHADGRLLNLDAAYADAREAAELAEAAGATAVFVDALGELAIAAGRVGRVDEALQHATRAVEVAETRGADARLHALMDLEMSTAWRAGSTRPG